MNSQDSAENKPAGQLAENGKTREHELISEIKRITGERLIGDDCAILPGQILVTADTLVEGVHFLLPGISFTDLGFKAVAVNVSDIAAMCGRPRYIVVSLSLPAHIGKADFSRLYESLVDCARLHRCRIVGGDLTRAPVLMISLTVIGEQHEAGVMTRSGASAGDVVVCTGDFGASAAGLYLLKSHTPGFPHCRAKHFRPIPRLRESGDLITVSQGRGALMDASDGLADALVQMATASNVSVEIDSQLIPVHEQTRKVAALAEQSFLDWALYGGEDYELVGCLQPQDWQKLAAMPDNPFMKIGSVKESGPNSLQMPDGSQQEITLAKTFQHWAG